MDKLIPVQGVDRPTFGGKKLHDRVIFPDFSAFQMTIAGAAPPARATDPAAGGQRPRTRRRPIARTPDPGPARRPGTNQGRLNAPPFSWLGGDAWPNFPLWADKPT